MITYIHNRLQNKINKIYFEENEQDMYESIYPLFQKNQHIVIIYPIVSLLPNNFIYYIQKLGLKISFIIDNSKIFEEINKKIEDEGWNECISIYRNISDISEYVDYIILFHIYSIDFFKNILDNITNITKLDTRIVLFNCFYNNKIKIYMKNILRNVVQPINNEIIYYNDFIQFLNDYNMIYDIQIDKVFKEMDYLIYGRNQIRQIILRKKW